MGNLCPGSSREFFESRISHDFSDVRVHSGVEAAESAQSVNALAYTHGKNIVFGAGQYQPETTSGRELLAHELTHVVQQSGEQTPDVQTLGDPSQAPASMTCPIATSSGPPVVDNISVSHLIECARCYGGGTGGSLHCQLDGRGR